jgi:hypothetical protein
VDGFCGVPAGLIEIIVEYGDDTMYDILGNVKCG